MKSSCSDSDSADNFSSCDTLFSWLWSKITAVADTQGGEVNVFVRGWRFVFCDDRGHSGSGRSCVFVTRSECDQLWSSCRSFLHHRSLLWIITLSHFVFLAHFELWAEQLYMCLGSSVNQVLQISNNVCERSEDAVFRFWYWKLFYFSLKIVDCIVLLPSDVM